MLGGGSASRHQLLSSIPGASSQYPSGWWCRNSLGVPSCPLCFCSATFCFGNFVTRVTLSKSMISASKEVARDEKHQRSDGLVRHPPSCSVQEASWLCRAIPADSCKDVPPAPTSPITPRLLSQAQGAGLCSLHTIPGISPSLGTSWQGNSGCVELSLALPCCGTGSIIMCAVLGVEQLKGFTKFLESENPRMIWTGWNIKAHLTPLPCHGKEHQNYIKS